MRAAAVGMLVWLLAAPNAAAAPITGSPVPVWHMALAQDINHLAEVKEPTKVANYTVYAHITGYNTVAGQTDSTPCLAAAGNICGRMDVVACPRAIPLRTWVRIDGKEYECMDRTAVKFDGRFDISCDKDIACAYKQTRWTDVEVLSP